MILLFVSNRLTMKKQLFPLLLVTCTLFVACNTTKKLYEAQEYDQVILTSAPKLCSGQLSPSLIDMVASSYHKANQADHERILALKATGEPDIWPEVFERYCSMKGRNEALSCLPQNIKKGINYSTLELDEPLTAARNKAEAYLEAKIAQSIQNGETEKIDPMIKELERVNPKNSKINEFKIGSIMLQADDILIGCTPRLGVELPIGVEQALLSFDKSETDSIPAKIHYRKRPGVRYGAIMDIFIRRCDASSNRDETVSFKESNGDKTVTVNDHNQSKSATIKGLLNIYDPRSGDLLVSVPLETESRFASTHTTIKGPVEACSEETLERLKKQAVPFPTDASIMMDAAREFNDLLVRIISRK